MWYVCAVIYLVFHGLVTWMLWSVGRQFPLGIGDTTLGEVLLGLMIGAGVFNVADEIKDKWNVR